MDGLPSSDLPKQAVMTSNLLVYDILAEAIAIQN